MKIEKVFGHDIIRIKCPNTEFYKNKELTSSLDRIFDLPEIKKFNYSRENQNGNGLTFSDHPYLRLTNLPGAQRLAGWVANMMLDAHPDGGGIDFIRSWSNRIFQGCSGRVHNHLGYGHVDIVGIFYVDVPTTGAELVFVKNGEKGKTHLDYDPADLYYITPNQGELILHDPGLYHTVAEHTEDITRTVFVFDAVYTV